MSADTQPLRVPGVFMTFTAYEEASWPRQFIAFFVDAALAYGAVFGVFLMLFDRRPDILGTPDITIVMALNALFFSLPSMIAGASPGALAARCRFLKDGDRPPGWILMLRGLYFFPLGVIVGGLHLPLKLLMNDKAPFDPIFGLQLEKRARREPAYEPAQANRKNTPRREGEGMMIFGTRDQNLDLARAGLERALGVEFKSQDSRFWGLYFVATGYGGASLMLLPNRPDGIDDLVADASYSALFHVEATGSRAALICDLIEATAFERLR